MSEPPVPRRSTSVAGRRRFLATVALGACTLISRASKGFAGSSAFQLRVMLTGTQTWGGPRARAPETWSLELTRRTSAPARMAVETVHASRPELLEQPVVLWAGERAVEPLTSLERSLIMRFLRFGGVIIVDDWNPLVGEFGQSVREQIRTILPQSAPVTLEPTHVIFKSFYLLERPVGRLEGPPTIDAVIRGGVAQVILLQHDLCGALARTAEHTWAFPMNTGSPEQREHAIRLAVNLAMYVLCSDYKDDQVHAPWLMRRRSRRVP